jgi:hypothetical protein
MAGIDLTTAQAKLTFWLSAEEAIGSGQEVAHYERRLTRADLAEVGRRIEFWDRKVKSMSRGCAVTTQRMVLQDG